MSKAPNILFIHSDSFDGRLLGCMNHPSMRGATPNIDRLAARGTIFENAYSNNPLCCPSRASMWSGQYTHHCEGWNNYKGLDGDPETFATKLADAGYRTGIFGKQDYLSGTHGPRARIPSWSRAAGIARSVHGEGHTPKVIGEPLDRVHGKDWQTVDSGKEWLKETSGHDDSFFLYLGFNAPHHPFLTSSKYLEKISADAVNLPLEDRLHHPVLPFQQMQKNWRHALDEESLLLRRQIYFAMIAEVDAMVGEVLAALEDSGLAQNTVVFFSSDHGEMAGEHGQYLKLTHFEASARVPLIVSGPDVLKAQRVSRPVSLVDLTPTFLDLAGSDTAGELDGCSLSADLFGGTSIHPGTVLAEYHSTTCPTGAFLLREGDWKYHVFAGFAPLLFNLKDDPDELLDRAGSNPEKVTEMDTKLREMMDYEAVDARAKEYDREQFATWREEQIQAGTYRDRMAELYSGIWLEPRTARPWTDAEESRIETWLAGNPVSLPDIPCIDDL